MVVTLVEHCYVLDHPRFFCLSLGPGLKLIKTWGGGGGGGKMINWQPSCPPTSGLSLAKLSVVFLNALYEGDALQAFNVVEWDGFLLICNYLSNLVTKQIQMAPRLL